MINKVLKIIIVVGVIYILYNIPYIQDRVNLMKADILEKQNNVVGEFNRVKDEVGEKVDSVKNAKESFDSTVDSISETVKKGQQVYNEVTGLIDGINNIGNVLSDEGVPDDQIEDQVGEQAEEQVEEQVVQ